MTGLQVFGIVIHSYKDFLILHIFLASFYFRDQLCTFHNKEFFPGKSAPHPMYSSFVLISEIFVSFDAESMEILPVTPVTVSHLAALPVTRWYNKE